MMQPGSVTDPQNIIQNQRSYELSMIETMCRGNQEKINKMISVFIDQVPASVDEIKSAYHKNDFTTIKNTAHRIKPSFAYYGIANIEKEINQIETLAIKGIASTEIENKIIKLEQVVNQVVSEMKRDFLYNL